MDLLTSLFDGQPHSLIVPMAAWLAGSRPYTAFVTANHNKIRKKIRSTHDPENIRDLALEFETAALLVRERALSLIYEPHRPGRGHGRGPDFAVSYTTRLSFMVEVTRARSGPADTSPERLTDIVCAKLGQLAADRPNLLIIGFDGQHPSSSDISDLLGRLQRRVEAHDADLRKRYGFRDRADFFKHFRRLSALLVRSIPLSPEPVLWLNPQASSPLPSQVQTALVRSHGA